MHPYFMKLIKVTFAKLTENNFARGSYRFSHHAQIFFDGPDKEIYLVVVIINVG